jgi:formylglycine-generating enzyme required for sulfatase activity
VRGGSVASEAAECRADARAGLAPDTREPTVGFRVALASDTMDFAALPARQAGGEPIAATGDSPAIGEGWTLPELGIEMVPVPAGQFTMGNDDSADGLAAPVHTVSLSRPFWMAKTEITQQTYASVLGRNPSYERGEGLPVFQVQWADAEAFCRQLTRRAQAAGCLPEGYVVRLPTEAEWEYACRAGTAEPLADVSAVAWCGLNSANSPQPVGGKPANAWGLCDMLGNVREWCHDWYAPYPAEDVVDPAGPASGRFRVTRGGSFADPPEACRATARSVGPLAPENGFRIVVAPQLDHDR